MAKERYKLIPVVYVVFIKNEECLLSRRFNTGHSDGQYGLVSGHVEADEPMLAAAVREAKEEAGVDILSSNLMLVHTLHRKCPDREDVNMFFECKTWSGEISNAEPHKCDDLSWFPKNTLPDNTLDYIKQALSCIEQKIPYSEFGW